jgi:hypothetical protein
MILQAPNIVESLASGAPGVKFGSDEPRARRAVSWRFAIYLRVSGVRPCEFETAFGRVVGRFWRKTGVGAMYHKQGVHCANKGAAMDLTLMNLKLRMIKASLEFIRAQRVYFKAADPSAGKSWSELKEAAEE